MPVCRPRGGDSDRNHVSLDTVRRRGRGRGVSGLGSERLSPKRGRGLTAITCPWIQFGDVGESGESPDGAAPVCHPSGEGRGLTTITCPEKQSRALRCSSETWERLGECPYGLYIREDAVGVFLCVGKLHLTIPFVNLFLLSLFCFIFWQLAQLFSTAAASFACCCLFCLLLPLLPAAACSAMLFVLPG